MYVIRNRVTPEIDFWSNESGWVEGMSADVFTQEERDTLNLPDEGEWASLWEVNGIQFARLIAEAEAAGLWDQEAIYDLEESMDLNETEIFDIINRAQETFAAFTAKLNKRVDRELAEEEDSNRVDSQE